MKKHLGTLLTGVVLGGLLTTGATVVASGVMAEKSTLPFYLNGKPVQVDAYLIGQNNYFKLRDIAALADFGVTWDPETGSVYIDTTVGYTPEPTVPVEIKESPKAEVPDSTTTDYSAQANQAVFTGEYTRDAYNALRSAMLTGTGKMDTANEKTASAAEKAAAAIGTYPAYDVQLLYDYSHQYSCAVTSRYPAPYEAGAQAARAFLTTLSGSEQDKLRAIAGFVCERLEYDAGSTTSPGTLFSDPGPHKGNCMSYARNFKFLCDIADIPCVFVHSETHQWNEVFVDGTWYSVDLTDYDIPFADGSRGTLLWDLQSVQGLIYEQTEPELTIFAKELLVPGSTQ